MKVVGLRKQINSQIEKNLAFVNILICESLLT